MSDKQSPSPQTPPEQAVDTTKKQPRLLGHSIIANGFNLSILAIIMAATLATVYINTQEQIQVSYETAKSKSLLEVIPSDWLDVSPLAYPITMPQPEQLNLPQGSVMYLLQQHDEINGWVMPARTNDGYNGRIDLLVGLTATGKIAGVRITQHQETPGLGDKIERKKSTWVDSFINQDLNNTVWQVKKDGGDFDQFTGATITPRAVVNQVKQVLDYYQLYQPTLTELAASADVQDSLPLKH